MTSEDRYVVEIAELTYLRLECVGCGTAVTVRTTHPSDMVPARCPGCGEQWFPPNSKPAEAVQRLIVSLHQLANLSGGEHPPVRVRFELPRPKA